LNRRAAISCLLLLTAGLSAQSPASRVVDRLVAVVNGDPIFASQVRQAARFARFSLRLAGGRPAAGPLTPAELASALRHLEDDTLLAQARADEGFPPPPASRLQAQAAAQARRWQAQAGGAAPFASLLAACGLYRAQAVAIAARQLALVAFLDQHFSGDPAPSGAAVQAYYTATFVPEARAHGLPPAPLAQVRDTIATLLRQRRRASEERALLARLRARAVIEVKSAW
jgi:hypothetical protein